MENHANGVFLPPNGNDVTILCLLVKIEYDLTGKWVKVHVLRGAIPGDGRDVTTHIYVPSIKRCQAVQFEPPSYGGLVKYIGMESEEENGESFAYARFDCTLQDILGMSNKYCFLTVHRSTLQNGRFFGML